MAQVQKAAFINRGRPNGLIVLPAGHEVARILPPLNISQADAALGADYFADAVADVAAKFPAKK